MIKRRTITSKEKRSVFLKTGGRCHFCGGELKFDAKRGESGRWNVDHVLQLAQRGEDRLENYLPICRICNRLRWHFKSEKIRELFRYGVIAYREAQKQTDIGRKIKILYRNKLQKNKSKRRGKMSDEYYL